MNTPNKLTLLRILLVIPFITFMTLSYGSGLPDFKSIGEIRSWAFLIAGIIFVIAMITDWIDGYLARKNNQVTTFGKLFDPLADKIITTTAMIFLSLMGIVPFYITIVFILRDVLVDGFRNLSASKKIDVSASIYGKIKTMIQSIGIVLLFIIYPITQTDFGHFTPINGSWELYLLNLPLFIAVSLSLLSGYLYFSQVKKYIDTK